MEKQLANPGPKVGMGMGIILSFHIMFQTTNLNPHLKNVAHAIDNGVFAKLPRRDETSWILRIPYYLHIMFIYLKYFWHIMGGRDAPLHPCWTTYPTEPVWKIFSKHLTYVLHIRQNIFPIIRRAWPLHRFNIAGLTVALWAFTPKPHWAAIFSFV